MSRSESHGLRRGLYSAAASRLVRRAISSKRDGCRDGSWRRWRQRWPFAWDGLASVSDSYLQGVSCPNYVDYFGDLFAVTWRVYRAGRANLVSPG
jgi:hypothetical protein